MSCAGKQRQDQRISDRARLLPSRDDPGAFSILGGSAGASPYRDHPPSPTLFQVRRLLRASASTAQARILQRFFKTGPGEYGEGDLFLGVRVPAIRKVVRQCDGLTLSQLCDLLRSPHHEERLLALLALVRRFERGDEGARASIFNLYLEETGSINNWDLVDLSAPNIVGAWLRPRDRSILDELAASRDLWRRRIAVLATFAFIRQGQFADTLRLCRLLLADKHDLMHKACGWMLREVGKRDAATLRKFLEQHSGRMPRTMLRYAIERLAEPERKAWLARPLQPTQNHPISHPQRNADERRGNQANPSSLQKSAKSADHNVVTPSHVRASGPRRPKPNAKSWRTYPLPFLVLALFWLCGQSPAGAQTAAAAPPAPTNPPPIGRIEPAEQDFYSRQLDCGGIPIKAHRDVSAEAMVEAWRRLNSMLEHLPAARSNLVRAGAELHIIGKDQVTSDLPEHRHLKGKPFEGSLTVDQRTRGLGGLLASCGEENLLRLEEDRYRGRDICRHEFAHTLLESGVEAGVRARFHAQRERSLAAGLWNKAYAGSNDHEFFAELTMWYFGTHGDLHMTGPKPADGPQGLRAYDPEAFGLMDDFYSGRIPVGEPPPRRRRPPQAPASVVLSNQAFQVEFTAAKGGVTSLKRTGGPDGVEFLGASQALGRIVVRYRQQDGAWQAATSSAPASIRAQDKQGLTAALSFAGSAGLGVLDFRESFAFRENGLVWSLRLVNTGPNLLEIGDLALPLPMNTDYIWDHEETYVRRLFKHAFIAGDGSFLYWLPVKGTGSFLVMLPEPGTSLEYFTATGMDYAFGREHFSVFLHSAATRESAPRGTWRQPATRCVLLPGEEVRYGFVFRWADNHDGVRQVLYDEGGVDVQVAPGMVIPQDLEARFALHTQRQIDRLEPEFPAQTTVTALGKGSQDRRLYRAVFGRLGENLLTVHFKDGGSMPLEFFSTQPLETLLRKRAAFIAAHQQHRDPQKWYDGLFSLWDRRQPPGRNLLGPDHPAGQPPYAVSGSDDPSNGKGLLLAEKNVAFPDAAEIEALEYFLKNFVWGKQQRTDREEPYPYGIYGADSWKQNRFAARDPLEAGISRPGGPSQCRMWRTFDYPTYFALYFDLYRIARQRPDLVHYLDAAGYLERAYGTARAYFEVPQHLRMEGGWSFTGHVYWQYTTGNFHEKYLLPLIEALEREGQPAKAGALRAEWEKKVKYFLYDNHRPFASEMPIDSTAYESTYAAADYALTHTLKPDTNLWYDLNLKKWFSHPVIDPAKHREFLRRQHSANLACRGVLEAGYWSLGSDFRGCGSASYTLSYMSQMGGWSVLDYALRHETNPAADLRLGYASMLSSWALMNAGDASSGYGFWTPGQLHDGAMSWGFQPRQAGDEWNPATVNLPRGAWPVCGEADHGLVAGLEAARTVLFDDPIFGVIGYGGRVIERGRTLRIIPLDGVRQRFSAVLGTNRVHLTLDRDGFAAQRAIAVARDLASLSFWLENRAGTPHSLTLSAEALKPGTYRLTCGEERQEVTVQAEGKTVFALRMAGPPEEPVTLRRIRSKAVTPGQ
jgi:3-methyladenine DNA glycosylase AlkD